MKEILISYYRSVERALRCPHYNSLLEYLHSHDLLKRDQYSGLVVRDGDSTSIQKNKVRELLHLLIDICDGDERWEVIRDGLDKHGLGEVGTLFSNFSSHEAYSTPSTRICDDSRTTVRASKRCRGKKRKQPTDNANVKTQSTRVKKQRLCQSQTVTAYVPIVPTFLYDCL